MFRYMRIKSMNCSTNLLLLKLFLFVDTIADDYIIKRYGRKGFDFAISI